MIWLVGALGLAIGFLIGIAADDALDLYRASRKERRAMRPAPRYDPRAWFTPRRTIVTLGVFLVLVQFTVGVLLIITYSTASRYTNCSADWQQQFGESYSARSDAAAEVSDALDHLIRAVAAQDDKAFQRALDNYINVRDRQEAARARTPLPEPPDVLCGNPEGS